MIGPASSPSVNEATFWEGLYARRSDRWELGGPTPPLVEYLARTPPPRGRVAVPGCGRGHDARLLARLGYRVWGFDFAAPAIGEARALAEREGLDVAFEQRDIFELATEYRGFFDGLWEYTCYCAIDPSRRAEYVRLVHDLLAPGGWLLACFFPVRDSLTGPRTEQPKDAGPSRAEAYAAYVDARRGPRTPGCDGYRPGHEGAGGPPFPTTVPEVRRLFSPAFRFLETYVPETSAEGRRGVEWWVTARREGPA